VVELHDEYHVTFGSFLWTSFGLLLSTLVVMTIPSAVADATATADNTQVCTIDARGQEICVDMTTTTTATTVPSSESDPKLSLKSDKLLTNEWALLEWIGR
jgi:hypothetical protein